MFGCPHKYGEIKEGYQYCLKCNKAYPAPPRRCEHKWVKHKNYEGTHWIGKTIALGYIAICEKCGEVKDFRLW